MAVAFQAYGRPLEMVMEFKYLGWVITASGGNWTAVVSNISKAFIIWASLSIILWQEGVDPLTSGTFYKAVVQETLLFGL